MTASDYVSRFIHDALQRGQKPQAIRDALITAGWPPSQVEVALSDWTVLPDMPPVPRPRPYVSAREAMLFGLLFLSLAALSWHICALGFELIDLLLPDGARYSYFSSSIRWAMAVLLIFGPLFVFLDRRLSRDHPTATGRGVEAQPVGGRSLVRRWIASATLLLASLVLLGDLVLTIYTLLDGDLTLRFILKSGLVAVMAGLILLYYRDEMNG